MSLMMSLLKHLHNAEHLTYQGTSLQDVSIKHYNHTMYYVWQTDTIKADSY